MKRVPGAEVETVSVKSNAGLLDEFGREIVDGRPMEPPLGFRRQPTIAEQIRNMVRSEALRREVEAAGAETLEEADDFDVGDDYDPNSPYEEFFDPVPVAELRERALADAAKKAVKPRSEPFAPQVQAPQAPGEPAQPAAVERAGAPGSTLS